MRFVPSLFSVSAHKNADNRPCSHCSAFSKPSLRPRARVFISLFINVEQWEQSEHEEESTTYRRRSAGNRRGTHGTRNTPGEKQRSNALFSQGHSVDGHAHHECFHLWRRPATVVLPRDQLAMPRQRISKNGSNTTLYGHI